jgi:hypothetical protein
MVLSMTFRQLGSTAMTSEAMWLTPVIVRSAVMHRVAGGWSRMLAVVLRRVLLGPVGLTTAGWALDLPSGPAIIFGRLSNLLSDGDGVRLAYDWRGQGSMKPCFRHWNVLRKGSDLAWRRPGYCEITCNDASVFRVWNAGAVYEAVDTLTAADRRVQAGTLAKARYNELEQATGLNLNVHGLLAAADLRQLSAGE